MVARWVEAGNGLTKFKSTLSRWSTTLTSEGDLKLTWRDFAVLGCQRVCWTFLISGGVASAMFVLASVAGSSQSTLLIRCCDRAPMYIDSRHPVPGLLQRGAVWQIFIGDFWEYSTVVPCEPFPCVPIHSACKRCSVTMSRVWTLSALNFSRTRLCYDSVLACPHYRPRCLAGGVARRCGVLSLSSLPSPSFRPLPVPCWAPRTAHDGTRGGRAALPPRSNRARQLGGGGVGPRGGGEELHHRDRRAPAIQRPPIGRGAGLKVGKRHSLDVRGGRVAESRARRPVTSPFGGWPGTGGGGVDGATRLALVTGWCDAWHRWQVEGRRQLGRAERKRCAARHGSRDGSGWVALFARPRLWQIRRRSEESTHDSRSYPVINRCFLRFYYPLPIVSGRRPASVQDVADFWICSEFIVWNIADLEAWHLNK